MAQRLGYFGRTSRTASLRCGGWKAISAANAADVCPQVFHVSPACPSAGRGIVPSLLPSQRFRLRKQALKLVERFVGCVAGLAGGGGVGALNHTQQVPERPAYFPQRDLIWCSARSEERRVGKEGRSLW